MGGLPAESPGLSVLPRDREAAVSALYVAHHGSLVGLARLLVDDLATAEDVVQDAFAALYRRWPFLRDRDAAYGYLRRSVVNGANSHLRRLRTFRSAVSERIATAPSPETNVLADEQQAALWAGLRALPRRQRQVLVLRYYLELSEAEIATTLGISRGSVKQHASRGLDALTGRMEAVR